MNAISNEKKIAPYLVLFLIHAMQIGVGMLGFQRDIARSAGYDSWISVIIATLGSNLILFITFKILELGKGDLVNTHEYIFGKIIGKLFNLIFIIYFTSLILAVVRSYVEIIEVWMFPGISVFWLSFSFMLLAMYVVNGGFRTIVGVAFFSVILPFYIYLAFLFAVPYSDYTDFLPILSHSTKDILKASFQLSLSFLGYETLLIYYPFIENPKRAKKWAHLGVLLTGFIYLFIVFISFGYYSQPQLMHLIWASLSIWKIVKLPFLWRFEFLGIAMYLLVILPNICLPLWCASRMMKNTIKLSQRKSMIGIAIVVVIVSLFFQTRLEIVKLLSIMNKVGFTVAYVYLPMLLIILLVTRKVKKDEK